MVTHSLQRTQAHMQRLHTSFPWTKTPLEIGAPMRIISGPKLAVRVSERGGLGFIGPGAKPQDLDTALQQVKTLLAASSSFSSSVTITSNSVLPISVGFQTWAGDLHAARDALGRTRVAAVWLFAPRHGQAELDSWTAELREVAPETQVWIQVASVQDAVAAATSTQRPDVLVIQGADAGGHSLTQGASIVTLLPEVADALLREGEGSASIPLIAAGGIMDGRGASAAFALGAAGVAIGTRLLASKEATINEGYQAHVLSAGDGGQSTVRTQLYNHLRGTTDWPAGYDARGIANLSWHEHRSNIPFETLKRKHDAAMETGANAWGENGRTATYAGTGIGLVRTVQRADEIVLKIRDGVNSNLQDALHTCIGQSQPYRTGFDQYHGCSAKNRWFCFRGRFS